MAGIAFQVYGVGFSDGLLYLVITGGTYFFLRFLKFDLKPVLLGGLGYTFLFIAGAELCRSKTEILSSEHFSSSNLFDAYIGVVNEEVTLKGKTYSTRLRVLSIHHDSGWKSADGNVLIYFSAQDQKWEYGDKVLISGMPGKVMPAMNPRAFDYAKYLSYKNIFHQHFLKSAEAVKLMSEPQSQIWMYAYKAREAMSGLLRSALGEGQEFAVASMIILGIKQTVDQDLTDAYASSGAMHVLAVSGLHVGMIFGLIQLLLGWLTRYKRWKHLFYLTALALIWAFGLITAFSPSVLRAVVMFTIIIIGQWIERKGNLYNTLGLTAFVILLFDPFMLMNVGFQMSFLAVFGIAYLNPQLTTWYQGKNMAVKWIWEITSISLCAQVFTFPLGLYYFNQFPTYFLISNLWVIPLSSIILYLGILFFVGSWLMPLKTFFGLILKYAVLALNKSMYIVSFLPGALQRTIYFDPWEISVLYFIIISLLLLFYFRNKVWLYSALFFVLIFSSARIYKIEQLNKTNRILVDQIKGKPAIIVWNAYQAKVWLPAKTDSDSYQVKTQILKSLQSNGVSEIELHYLPDKMAVWNYRNIKVQLIYSRDLRSIRKDVNYVCLPYNFKDLVNCTHNTQIKRVILYNNKSIDKTTVSTTWDINANGVFTVDI